MADVAITRSGELEVAGVEAESDAGFEFVDAWFPKRKGAEVSVVDSGRLVIEGLDVDEFVKEARAAQLEVNLVDGI